MTRKRKPIPQGIRQYVWNEHIGPNKRVGKCMICNGMIAIENFECGHIQSVAKDGDDSVNNLRPVCSSCNKSMGKKNMRDYMDSYGIDSNRLDKKSSLPARLVKRIWKKLF